MSVAAPVATASSVPLLVGQSIPKNGAPRITLLAGTIAVYCVSVVRSLNMPEVSGETADAALPRFNS